MDSFHEYVQTLANYALVTHGDSSYADDLRHRRSTTGSIHMLWGGLIDFICKLQTTIAHSTAEAELCGNTMAAKKTRYHQHIFRGMGINVKAAGIILVDNESARKVAKSEGTSKRLRHVDVQHFAIQDWTDNGDIDIQRVDTEYNLGDLPSKIATLQVHARLILRIFGYHGPQTHIITQERVLKSKPRSVSHHVTYNQKSAMDNTKASGSDPPGQYHGPS